MRYFVIIFIVILLTQITIATKARHISAETYCCSIVHKGEPIYFSLINEEGKQSTSFIAGNTEIDAKQVNITNYIQCCDYVSDTKACFQCIQNEQQYSKNKTSRYVVIGSLILVVLLFAIYLFRFINRKLSKP